MGVMRYTEEMRRFLYDNHKGVSSKELAKRLNDNFDCSVTERQMLNFKKNNKLNSGLTGHFEKGAIPANKGKKMSPEHYEKCKPTMFKKGNIPPNRVPVGSERICKKDGYILVKVEGERKNQLKQRLVWEQTHGNIPKGHIIIFLDGDKTNTDISNLDIIPRSLNAVLNHKGLRSNEKQLTEAGIALGKLMQATNKAKRSK